MGDFTKIPNGAAGIEDRLQLLYTHGVASGRFDIQRLVQLTSTHAARVFGLYPRKGTIAPGTDADLVIYDPTGDSVRSAKTHHSRADRSIFEGFPVKGRPSHVIANGAVRVEDGKLKVERGSGRFIARKPRPVPVHPTGVLPARW